jgi:hypothetical protein
MGRSMHDTIYVQNKSLHQTLKNITLEEVFTGMKHDIEHFKLFGCPVYFHLPKEKKSKLDALGRKDTVHLQRHPRSASLVRERLRQVETLSLKKRQSFKDPENLRWILTLRQYLLPLQPFRGRQTLLQVI